jgi:hypothetical protein
MRTPVASIRNLLVVVLVIALDCYLIQYCLDDDSYLPYEGLPLWFRVGFAGSLPMANAVVVGGALILPWRKGSRPLLAGFVLAGAFALAALLALSLVLPKDWFTPIYLTAHDSWWKLYLDYHYTFGLSRKDYLFTAEMVLFTVLFTIPEFLIAMTGGLLALWSSRGGRVSGRESGTTVLPSDPS